MVQQVFSKAQPCGGLLDALPAETKREVTVGIYYTAIVHGTCVPLPIHLYSWRSGLRDGCP